MKTNWLTRFLGLHDREQKARTREVTEYVEHKKSEFVEQMRRVKQQSQIVHKKQLQVHKETAKLVEMVDDVTTRIMRATGGEKRG